MADPRTDPRAAEPRGTTEADLRTDLQLLELWQTEKEDREAGVALVVRYNHDLIRFFRNTVGDDDRERLVQDTFKRLRTDRGAFRRDAGMRTHLFRLGRLALLDHLQQGSSRTFDPRTCSVAEVSGAGPVRPVASLRSVPFLECLRTLPVDSKQLIELYYWHGCTLGELGKIFEQSVNEIREWLPEAMAALREALAKRGEAAKAGETNAEQALEQVLRELGALVRGGAGSSHRIDRAHESAGAASRPEGRSKP
jgi:RNA polymerase sigma factor (sigma-70 family)